MLKFIVKQVLKLVEIRIYVKGDQVQIEIKVGNTVILDWSQYLLGPGDGRHKEVRVSGREAIRLMEGDRV